MPIAVLIHVVKRMLLTWFRIATATIVFNYLKIINLIYLPIKLKLTIKTGIQIKKHRYFF
jgi:hypothetical protein